jgi:hypothetical protein
MQAQHFALHVQQRGAVCIKQLALVADGEEGGRKLEEWAAYAATATAAAAVVVIGAQQFQRAWYVDTVPHKALMPDRTVLLLRLSINRELARWLCQHSCHYSCNMCVQVRTAPAVAIAAAHMHALVANTAFKAGAVPVASVMVKSSLLNPACSCITSTVCCGMQNCGDTTASRESAAAAAGHKQRC